MGNYRTQTISDTRYLIPDLYDICINVACISGGVSV